MSLNSNYIGLIFSMLVNFYKIVLNDDKRVIQSSDNSAGISKFLN